MASSDVEAQRQPSNSSTLDVAQPVPDDLEQPEKTQPDTAVARENTSEAQLAEKALLVDWSGPDDPENPRK